MGAEKPHAHQIAHGSRVAISLGKVFGVSGQPADQLGDDQIHRVKVKDVHQHDPLVFDVLFPV